MEALSFKNLTPDKINALREKIIQLPPEQFKKIEQEIAPIFAKQQEILINAQRLRYYAKSLEKTWKEIEGSNPSWPITYGAKPPRDSCCFTYDGGPTLPFAHMNQRAMTYPWEDPLELLKVALAKFHVYFAGNRGGKSVFGAAWVAMECVGIHPLQKLTWGELLARVKPLVSELRMAEIISRLPKTFKPENTIRPKPPLHCWLAAPDLPSEADIPRGEDTTMVKKLYEWAEYEIKKFYRKDKILTWKSGSVINFKGYQQDKDAYKSDDIDILLFDEEPPKFAWDEGMMRIIDKFGIFIIGMTPDYSSVWSYSIRQREKNNPDYHFSPPSGAKQNPFISPEEVQRSLGGKSADEQLMRGEGLHVQFKGKVFPFETTLNVGQPFEINNNSTHYVIIDWHPVKPICTSFLAVDPRGIWYVWDESIQEDHLVSVLAQDILSRLSLSAINIQVHTFIIDRLAVVKIPNEETKKSESIVDMLRKWHINCKIGNTDFDSAHAFLCQKIKNREFYIDPECTFHVEQFDTWGSKRYQKGYLEGTLRDQLEADGNDTPMNMIYAYNGGAKFRPKFDEEQPGERFRRPGAVQRIYGGRAA